MDKQLLPAKLEIEIIRGKNIKKRFRLPITEFGPKMAIRFFDPKNNKDWAYVVVDNLERGPSLGGIRLAEDVTMNEVYELASAMTFKSASAMLPLGGGKSGILGDPDFFYDNPLQKEKLITLFAEALWPVKEYIPGPDMGTNEEDMQLIYEVFSKLNKGPNHGRGGVGRPPGKGGLPLDEWGLTAHGLFAAAQAAEVHEPNFQIEGAKVIVQGYGNVGSHIATKLSDVGAVIVGASDIHTGLYHPDGLDVNELNQIRNEKFGLMLYTGATRKRFVSENLDNLLNIECDILIPAARTHAITFRNADKIKTRLILQGANHPIDKVTEYYLKRKYNVTSLTDFIVNAGGIIACAVELKMDNDKKFREKVLKEDGLGKTYLEKLTYKIINDNVNEIYTRLNKVNDENIMWRDLAFEIAKERLRNKKGENPLIIEDLR